MSTPPNINVFSLHAAGEPQKVQTTRLKVPRRPSSRTPSPTQYEFISSTGNEDPSAVKQKLKTVRSHVMKNYLHQQQQGQQSGRGSEESLLSAKGERRKGKQRSRASRSVSRESEPCLFDLGIPLQSSPPTGIESLLHGFSLSHSFSGYGIDDNLGSGEGHSGYFGMDFGYNSTQDEVSAYSQYYIDSLLRDKKVGLLQPTFDTLNCKVELVRIIKETLSVCGDDVPDSLVLAVNVLAFGCAIDNEWDEARGHVEALQRMISGRGIDSFTFELRRAFTWTVYTLATPLSIPPLWPPPLYTEAVPFPLAFLDEAQIRAWRTVKRFPKDNSFVFDAVVRLHQLSLAISNEWNEQVDHRSLSNLYFEALHTSIAVQNDEPWALSLPNGSKGRETAMMFKVWTLGLPSFIWATVRHARSRIGSTAPRCDFEPVYGRLKELLGGPVGSHAWPRGKSLEAVLATLFYSIEACDFTNPWRIWLSDTIRRAVEILKIKRVEEFRKTLEFFPCSEEHKVAADDLWAELFGGSAITTPTLTLSPFVE